MYVNRSSRAGGFTLIELLIVVAIIGLLAAIAIPNLLNAMQRAKQKRTLADIRNIAMAWEAYAVENSRYSPSAYDPLTAAISPVQVRAILSPTYMRAVPLIDGWSMPWNYTLDAANGAQRYQIVSYGRNLTADVSGLGSTTDFDQDIVFENGQFIVYPEGAQSNN